MTFAALTSPAISTSWVTTYFFIGFVHLDQPHENKLLSSFRTFLLEVDSMSNQEGRAPYTQKFPHLIGETKESLGILWAREWYNETHTLKKLVWHLQDGFEGNSCWIHGKVIIIIKYESLKSKVKEDAYIRDIGKEKSTNSVKFCADKKKA